MLSPRGTVLENGMPRFFRRLREGVFDEDDLRGAPTSSPRSSGTAGAGVRHRRGSLVAVGFSNGANIASALLLRHPELLAGAVLFAAMVPFADPPEVDLTGTWSWVQRRPRPTIPSRPHRDGWSPAARARADVVEVPHPGGHQISPAVLPRIADVLARPERLPDLGG